MLIQQILLKIFHTLQNERTISAAYHLLRGKRSGQTIQDVGIFKLHPFFGLLPKLTRKNFDAEVDLLLAKNYINIEENGFYRLTEQGIDGAGQPFPYVFDGWHYRGNEHLFFARLSLIVQSLSHQAAGRQAFIAIEKNEDIQRWVREFLLANNYQSKTLQQELAVEIEQSLSETKIDESSKEVVMYRLTGFGQTGLTWQQLSFAQGMQELDIQLLYICCLHNWLNVIMHLTGTYPLLQQMAVQVKVDMVLTDSAYQTAQLFKQGHAMERISGIRRLKMSTIEDHLVEIAMNDTEFPIEQFVTEADCENVRAAIEDYNTKKLKVLYEVIGTLSYFQIRLILAKGVEQ